MIKHMNASAFLSHSVFLRLQQFEQSLQSEKLAENIGLDNFSFLKASHGYLRDKLRLTLASLVQDAELNSISSDIEAGTSQINAYIGSGNIGHISNAINSLYSAITRAKNLPLPVHSGDYDFSKAVAQFQQSTQEASGTIELKVDNLNAELELLKNELNVNIKKLSELDKLMLDKQTEIQNVLLVYNTEFENLKANANALVETDRRKFADNFESDRKALKDSIDNDLERYKKEYEALKAGFSTKAETFLQELEIKLSDAKKIVNIVGNVGVTGNYQKIANAHHESANTFRWIAMGFMVIMSGLLIYSIIDLSRGEFDLYKSLVRILAAAVLTYPAVYASRESSRHRNLETQNRKLELELASIGPFIELLPEDKKQIIKESLVSKYFGNNGKSEGHSGEERDDISVSSLEKILKTILPHLKK